jgi:hypothetical protein
MSEESGFRGNVENSESAAAIRHLTNADPVSETEKGPQQYEGRPRTT